MHRKVLLFTAPPANNIGIELIQDQAHINGQFKPSDFHQTAHRIAVLHPRQNR